MIEQWRDVVGYEGYYQVSNFGRVRSVDRVVPGRWGPTKLRGKINSQSVNSRGYFRVIVSKEGVGKDIYVHRLVAAAWIGPCPDGQQVRHGPNGRFDNSISNLCYGTPSEDGLDKRRDGTHTGRPVPRSDGTKFISMAVAAEETGCGVSGISAVCNGKGKAAGGFGWEYI